MKLSAIVKLSLLTLLLLALALCAASCNGGNNDNNNETTGGGDNETTTTGQQETEAPAADLTLIEDNKFLYTIVIPEGTTSTMAGPCERLRSTVIALIKSRCDVITYDKIDTATTDRFIYVGFFPGEMEGSVREEKMIFASWMMEVINDKDIYISAYSADSLYGGVDVVASLVEDAYQNGTATISVRRTVGTYHSGTFSYLPVPESYTREMTQKEFSSGVGVTQFRLDGISSSEAVKYLSSLKNYGLVEHSTFGVGNVYGGTYYVENKVVYYITHHTGALRINAMTYSEAFLPENVNEPNFTKVCNPKGYMIGVSADDSNTQNGMCFVYLLGDGTFLVFDGGRSSTDAGHLYTWLSNIAKENDIDDIVISAMQVTHAHGDHHGFFDSFMSLYVKTGKVTVKSVWLNRGTADQGAAYTQMASGEGQIVGSVLAYSPDTKVIPLHTGQSFYVADVLVDVMHTMEDFDQYKCYAANDTNAASTTIRLTINDKTVLMTGDAYCDNTNMMAEMYKGDLQCDFLQVPHHGVWREENGTRAFYDVVRPTYALFPCGEKLYKDASSKQLATVYLLNNVMAGHNTIGQNVFIAGHYASGTSERVTEINFNTGKVTVLVNKGQ